MLIKNVLLSIKNKPIRLIGITLLVVFASILYVSVTYALNSVEDQLYDYVEDYNQEDFTFDMNPKLTPDEKHYLLNDLGKTYTEDVSLIPELSQDDQQIIVKRRMDELEDNLQISIEMRVFKQVTYDNEALDKSVTVRVFTDNQIINKTYLEEGRLATAADEIAINKSFATANNLTIGDSLTIKDQTYTITGYVYFVDYIYPQLSDFNFIFDASKQVLSQMSNQGFEQLNERESIYFSGVYNNNSTSYDDIQDDTSGYMWNLSDAKSEFRTGAIYSEVSSNKAMSYSLSGGILFLAIIIIGIIVNKSINKERTQIGVIKALGYSNREIVKGYMIYPFITSVLGSLIGYFAGYILSEPLLTMFSTYYQMPFSDISHSWDVIMTAIIFPIVLLNVFGAIVIYFIVRKKPLDLIKVTTSNKVNRVMKGFNQFLHRFSFKTRFKYSVATRGLGKLTVTFIGIMIASIYLVFAISGMKSFDTIIDETFGNSTYDYQITFSEFINDEVEESFDRYMLLPSSLKTNEADTEEVSLIGLEEELHLFSLENDQNISLLSKLYEHDNHVVITSMLSMLNGIEVGDTITIITPNNEEKELVVVGVTENYMNPYIYMQIKVVNQYIGLNEEHYNGLWTNQQLEHDKIATTFDKADMIETMEEMMEIAKGMIFAMVIVSIILALIVLVLIANFNIEDNFKMISFLKVIGYTKKEISSMVLNIYLPIVLLGYLISVPVTLASLSALMSIVSEELNFVIPFKMNAVQIIIGAVIIVVTYYGSLWISKRKLEKVSLQETLKYNE